jgi:hypothetical protein
MGFDETQNDIHSPIAELMSLLEHPVCFAYPRGSADINFEPPLLTPGNEIEESFRLDSLVIIIHSGSGRTTMISRNSIESHVQQQYIDAGLAKNSSPSRTRIFGDKAPHLIFAQASRAGNTCHLQVSSGGTYLGV